MNALLESGARSRARVNAIEYANPETGAGRLRIHFFHLSFCPSAWQATTSITVYRTPDPCSGDPVPPTGTTMPVMIGAAQSNDAARKKTHPAQTHKNVSPTRSMVPAGDCNADSSFGRARLNA